MRKSVRHGQNYELEVSTLWKWKISETGTCEVGTAQYYTTNNPSSFFSLKKAKVIIIEIFSHSFANSCLRLRVCLKVSMNTSFHIYEIGLDKIVTKLCAKILTLKNYRVPFNISNTKTMR